MSGRVVVVGIGNPWRRDDGAGPAVAAIVRSRRPDVEVRELDGEATRLVEAWDGADLAVVVDAARTGAPPGTVHRFDPDAMGIWRPASSHGTGVQHAAALGRALGRLPRRLVVLGVEGRAFGHGTSLSDPVAAAVDTAARIVADVIEERG